MWAAGGSPWNRKSPIRVQIQKSGRDPSAPAEGKQILPYKGEKLRPGAEESLFRDDAVGPLDQAHKNRRIAELCAPLRYICFRDPTGPAAGSSRKDGNVFGHNLLEGFAKRGPAQRHDRVHRRLAHQMRGLPGEKNLHLVTGLGERESMQKGKRRPGGIVRSPGALHHDLESFHFWLLGLCGQRKKGQAR